MKKKLRFKDFFKSFMIIAVLCFSQISLGQIYQHNFGTGTISGKPYNVSPNILNANLSSSSWNTSAISFINYAGSTGEALSLANSGGTVTYTLTFNVNAGYSIDITSLSFWHKRSSNGAQNYSITINGGSSIASGSISSSSSGQNTGNINVTGKTGLTGTVTLIMTLSGALGSGTFRLDDFTINGTVNSLNSAPTASNVSISGTTEVGETLTGSYTYNDTENDPQGTSIFKWYRADNASGLNEVAIAGATSSTYTLTIDDLNKFIKFGVVPVASLGTSTGLETFSNYVGSIGLGNTPNLTIAGSLNEATLNNTTLTLTLANETFIDATLDSSNFTLNNAPSGVSIASVNYIDPSSASLTLAYDNTDFDSNITDFNITISAVELTASNPLTSNNLTINGLVETLTVGTISSFGNQCVDFLSAEQSFTISGSNLKAGTITLAALSSFSYSETANGTYTSTLSFSNTAGTLTNKTIFVKFLPTAVQSYNGNIVVSSVDAPNVNRSVVGSGINTLPVITTPTSTSITDSSATLGGNITVVGCSSITERGIYYSTVSGFANGDGTKVSTFGTYSTGVFTIPVTGLSSNTVYYYKAFASSASGTAYTTQGTFTTNVLPVNVPYFQDFEGATNDFVLDATGTNRWTIGTGTNNGGTKALYISNNDSSNAYTFNSTQNGTFASLQVDLSSIANATLSFDWRSNGEEFGGTVYDYGEVYVNAGSGDILVSNANEFYNSLVFENKQIDLSPFVGGVITVKFKWVNDNVAGNQPPFAVDNISILPYGLPVLSTATVSNVTYNSAISGGTVTSDGGDLITARGIVYATTSNPTLANNVVNNGSDLGTFISNLTGLNSNTTYYLRAFATNTNGTYYGNEESFITPAIDAPVATVATSIDDTSFIANWDAVSGADAYLLDVISGFENQTIIETFSSIGGGTSSSYNNRTWIGTNGITWTAYNSRTDQDINSGNDAITLRDATGSYLESGSIGGNPSSISFQIQQKFSGSGGSVTLKILSGVGFSTSTTIGNYPFNTSIATINATISGITGPFKIVIENDGTTRPCIDNLTFDFSTITYFAGFENLNVGNVLTYNITGLESGTKYYYRVRASNTSSTSVDSNVIELTTVFTSVTWNGTSWTNTVGPDSSMDAIIEGVYSTSANGAFNAKSVTVNSGSLTVNSNTTIEIQEELVNNMAAANVIVENDGILRQINNAINVGQITVRRNSADALRLDYTAWSSPVSGQNALAFSPATLPNRFYDYDAASNAYVSIVPSTTDFSAGKGILIRTPNTWSSTTPAAYPGEFVGVPNNGTVTTPVLAGFNLLGNPYSSPISAADLLSNTNNNGLGVTTLYFWTHKHPATGSTYGTNNYASYNSVGGTPANVGEVVPDGIIQVGQGFLVNATASGSAEMNNAMRLSASNGQFFKTSRAVQQSTTIEKHRMWFGLTSPTGNHNVALVGYVQGATNAIDNSFDAKLFGPTNSVLYSNINNEKYVIQGRGLPFNALDVVPLGLIAQTAGPYTISMTNFDGLFASQDIYLKDNLLNITHDIKGSPYTFVSDAGQFDARFEVVYATPLSSELAVFTEDSVIVYTDEAGITINAGHTIIDNVKVFDARGRLLFTQSNINANAVILDTINATNEMLILKIVSTTKEVISKKVIK